MKLVGYSYLGKNCGKTQPNLHN